MHLSRQLQRDQLLFLLHKSERVVLGHLPPPGALDAGLLKSLSPHVQTVEE